MKHPRLLCCLLLTLLLAACAKKEEATPRFANGLEGSWAIDMVLRNDHWGAPLYWQPAQSQKQVRFTADGGYYEKPDGATAFVLAGTYEVVSEDQLTITWATPELPEFPAYTFTYAFEPGAYLVLQKQQLEGEVAERYRLAE